MIADAETRAAKAAFVVGVCAEQVRIGFSNKKPFVL